MAKKSFVEVVLRFFCCQLAKFRPKKKLLLTNCAVTFYACWPLASLVPQWVRASRLKSIYREDWTASILGPLQDSQCLYLAWEELNLYSMIWSQYPMVIISAFFGREFSRFCHFYFFEKYHILFQDFSSLKTKVFLGAVLNQVSYISIPNWDYQTVEDFCFIFWGQLVLKTGCHLTLHPSLDTRHWRKNRNLKKKMLAVMFITIVIVIFVLLCI